MKYMGSKSRIAKYIVPIIQECIDKNDCKVYLEPFVGGANIIDKIKCKTRIGEDINLYLIALFKWLQNGNELPDSISREEYSKVRSDKNNFHDWYVGCIGFLASFNGRFFDGGFARPGYEKTKNGQRYRDYYQESKSNIINQINTSDFNTIVFKHNDYRLREESFHDCVVYVDPPYQGTKQYANSKVFDYIEFWDIVREWSKRNIVLVSEQNAPDDFKTIWEQSVSRSIKAGDKSSSVEKLFTYEFGKYYDE